MRNTLFLVSVVISVALSFRIRAAEPHAHSRPSGGERVTGTQYADYVIGEPTTYKDLSIFPISSRLLKNQDRYTTLDEGLASGSVKIVELGAEQSENQPAAANVANDQIQQSGHQTGSSSRRANQPANIDSSGNDDLFGPSGVGGDVNKLMVVNKSGKPLYLMPGEVISGGEQDRTIGEETVIDSTGKPVPIEVFCIEHGRWAGRDIATTALQLGSAEFNRSQSVVVSQTQSVKELAKESSEGKFVASVGQLNKESRRAVQESKAQEKVWEEVGKANSKAGNKSDSSNFSEN